MILIRNSGGGRKIEITPTISVSVNDRDLDLLAQKSREAGMSMGRYVQEAILKPAIEEYFCRWTETETT